MKMSATPLATLLYESTVARSSSPCQKKVNIIEIDDIGDVEAGSDEESTTSMPRSLECLALILTRHVWNVGRSQNTQCPSDLTCGEPLTTKFLIKSQSADNIVVHTLYAFGKILLTIISKDHFLMASQQFVDFT